MALAFLCAKISQCQIASGCLQLEHEILYPVAISLRGKVKNNNLSKFKDELSMLCAGIHNLFLRKRIIA